MGKEKKILWVIYQVIKIHCRVADLFSILWCRCKYCVHVCCRPLWVEYPQDLATFALEDEYLIGKTSNKIWGLQHSSSIHSDNCSLSLKDPSLSDLGLKVTPFTGSSTDTLLNKGSLMFKHAMSLSGTLFLSPYCAFLSCDSHDASLTVLSWCVIWVWCSVSDLPNGTHTSDYMQHKTVQHHIKWQEVQQGDRATVALTQTNGLSGEQLTGTVWCSDRSCHSWSYSSKLEKEIKSQVDMHVNMILAKI